MDRETSSHQFETVEHIWESDIMRQLYFGMQMPTRKGKDSSCVPHQTYASKTTVSVVCTQRSLASEMVSYDFDELLDLAYKLQRQPLVVMLE